MCCVVVTRCMPGVANMATGQDGKAGGTSDVDLLLHPELLSQDFMQMILNEVSQGLDRNVESVM